MWVFDCAFVFWRGGGQEALDFKNIHGCAYVYGSVLVGSLLYSGISC